MDILQGYGDASPHASQSEEDNSEQVVEDKEQQMSPQEEDECSPKYVEKFVASLPSFFRCDRSSPTGEESLGTGEGRHDVYPRVVMTVEKWIQMKNKGYTITQDLRKRNWYKSPDMMMSMLEKFDIDDCGTFLDHSNDGTATRSDIRRLWSQHEERRKTEKEMKRLGRNVEFTRGDAVSAAVAAAQAHAASFRR